MPILGRPKKRTVILGQLDDEGKLIGGRNEPKARVDVSDTITPPGAEGFELEQLIDRITSEIDRTASTAVSNARTAGRIRADIEMIGLREGDRAKAPDATESDEGLTLMTEVEIRATGEGRIRQVLAESILRAENIERRVDEQLRVSGGHVTRREHEASEAKHSIDRARGASDAQAQLPELEKSQRIEADLVASLLHYSHVLRRLESASDAKEALAARSEAVSRFVAGLPGLRDNTLRELEDSISGSFKQGYMERMVEIRNEQLNPKKSDASTARVLDRPDELRERSPIPNDSAAVGPVQPTPWYRRHRLLAALVLVLVVAGIAAAGFTTAWALRGSSDHSSSPQSVTKTVTPSTSPKGQKP